MNPLLEQFLLEARENLKFIETHLEELESADDELLNSIFRAAHTLKGGSGIVGFDAVKNITHSAEDLLDMLRSKKIAYKKEMQGALFDAFDEVLNLVEAAESCGDVVEANQEVEKRVVSQIRSIMGCDDEVVYSFVLPFRIVERKESITELDLGFLERLDVKIPYKYDDIEAENLNDIRLYGVLFDASSDCMVYGNDPIYVLSLLKDALIGIDFCISEDDAKDILSGFNNEDGMELKSRITAFVYTSYETIQEALYNFIDDIYFLPLDIKTLLDIDTKGLQSSEMLIEVCKAAKNAIEKKSPDALKDALDKTLQLLNPKSREFFVLKRVRDILHLVSLNEFEKLGSLFDAIYPKVAEQGLEVGAKAKDELAKVTGNVDENSIEVVRNILLQQLNVFKYMRTESAFLRSLEIAKKCAAHIGIEAPDAANIDELISWISEYLGIQKPFTQSQHSQKEESGQKERVVQQAVQTQQTGVQHGETHKAESKQVTAPEAKKDVIGKVVKVEQESIDLLMSVVGELLVAKNSLPYLADSVISMDPDSIKRAVLEKYSFINRLTNQLQDLIMGMRMLPISYVFDRYPKLVREISKKLDKQVRLIQEGGDTKLDKNMIEMLADPLVHIVRNSLDHGIETPSERKAKGKDETGTITMKAYPQSDKVIIEIIDDGKGIDANKVVRKVLEKGLIPMEKIEAMSESERVELIMLPGLSTAETITEYSGRGVGMDVVKKSIEGFGGNIEIKTVVGMGTTIKLSIPVSLAVTTLLHVLMKGDHYGFPMEYVSETVKIDRSEITHLHNEPFIYIRDHVVPLLHIDKMLDASKEGEPLSIVVLNIKGNQIAVSVNELLGQLDVVQKPLEGILAHHPIISGTALLGNGQIIMVLDPYGLLSLCDSLKSREVA